MKNILIYCLFLILSNCASVKIYTDEKDFKSDNEVGLKFYQPKPFLLVEYNPSKDVNIKTSIVYLPDLSNPRYVKVRGGWGSANATVGFANGVLSSYGAIADSKGPETITGLATAVTSLGGTALSLAQVDEIKEKIKSGIIGADGEQAGGDEETIKIWKEALEKLDKIIGEAIPSGDNKRDEIGLSKLRGTNDLDEKERKEIIKKLKAQSELIAIPSFTKSGEIVESITQIANRIKELDLVDTPPKPEGQIKSKETLSRQLLEIAKSLTIEEIKVVKYWELYEMIHDDETESIIFKKITMPDVEN